MKVPSASIVSFLKDHEQLKLGIQEELIEDRCDVALLLAAIRARLAGKYDELVDDAKKRLPGRTASAVVNWLEERRSDIDAFIEELVPVVAYALSGVAVPARDIPYPAPVLEKKQTSSGQTVSYIDLPKNPVSVLDKIWLLADGLSKLLKLRLEGNDVAVATLDGVDVEVAMPLGLVSMHHSRNTMEFLADIMSPTLSRYGFEKVTSDASSFPVFTRKASYGDTAVETHLVISCSREKCPAWELKLVVGHPLFQRTFVSELDTEIPKYFKTAGEIATYAERLAESVVDAEKKAIDFVARWAEILNELRAVPKVAVNEWGTAKVEHRTRFFKVEATMSPAKPGKAEMTITVKIFEQGRKNEIAMVAALNTAFSSLVGNPRLKVAITENYSNRLEIKVRGDHGDVAGAFRAFADANARKVVETAEELQEKGLLSPVLAFVKLAEQYGFNAAELVPSLAGYASIRRITAHFTPVQEPDATAKVNGNLEVMVNGVWLRDILTAVGGLDATRAREIERELALKLIEGQGPGYTYIYISDVLSSLLDASSSHRAEILAALSRSEANPLDAEKWFKEHLDQILSLDDERFAEFAIVTARIWIFAEPEVRTKMLERANKLSPELVRKIADDVGCYGDTCLAYIPSKGGLVVTASGVIADPSKPLDHFNAMRLLKTRIPQSGVVAWRGPPVAYYVEWDELKQGKIKIHYVDAREGVSA